jgi:uncharacterized membrane protein
MKTKEAYMQELAHHIRTLPEADRKELLADYEAHFAAGRENGKSDEDISRSLGTPKSVAQEILMNTWVKQIDEAPAAMRLPSTLAHIALMILILAPFNFFMLVCPFLILFMFVLVGWTVPVALGGIAVGAFTFFFQRGGDPVGMLSGLSLFCMFLGMLGLAATASMIMLLITRGAFQLLISFFKWNLDFINSRRAPAPAVAGGNV